jgi:hypothetical protein
MRTTALSLILAFTVMLATASMAGSPGGGAPNAGLFAIMPPASLTVASR